MAKKITKLLFLLVFISLMMLAFGDTRLSSARRSSKSQSRISDENQTMEDSIYQHCQQGDGSCRFLADVKKHGTTVLPILLFITAMIILNR